MKLYHWIIPVGAIDDKHYITYADNLEEARQKVVHYLENTGYPNLATEFLNGSQGLSNLYTKDNVVEFYQTYD